MIPYLIPRILGFCWICILIISCSTSKTEQETRNASLDITTQTDQTEITSGLTLPEVPQLPQAHETSLSIEQMKQGLESLSEWSLEKPIEIYNPDNLSDLINGSAEDYLAYSVQSLIYVPSLQYQTVTLSMYIFNMGSALSAYGIYSSERPPVSTPAQVSNDGYWQREELVFWDNQYYLKIRTIAGAEQQLSPKVAEQLAHGIKRMIPRLDSPIDKIKAIFPTEHRKPHSFMYQPDSFEGLEFFKHIFRATYTIEGREVKLFLCFFSSNENAKSALQAYHDFATDPDGCDGNAFQEHRSYTLDFFDCVYFPEKQYIIQHEKLLAGIFGTMDIEAAYEMLASLVQQASPLELALE